MDEFFDRIMLAHLDAWLDHEVDGDDCRAEVKAAMLQVASDDPEYWAGQSWPNLFDQAKCWKIVEKHRA